MRNNGGGHYNHTLFWESMSPDGGGAPDGDLAAAIDSAFGSFDDFKAKFKEAGVGQFGSGWAWLVHDGSGLAVVGTRQPGQPDLSRPDAAAGRRRLGARLLPQVPEQAPRLPRGVVERRQARVTRRPATGESCSSSWTRSCAGSIDRGGLGRAASASSFARRAGRRSSAFCSSIRWIHWRPPRRRAGPRRSAWTSRTCRSRRRARRRAGPGDLAQRLAAAEDQALVLGAGDPEVGVRGLADAVDGAAEDRDLDRVVVGLEPALDLGHDGVHVELEPAAGRAGDQHRAALAQVERLEDLPGDLDLLLGVEGRERDADRVADPVGEQRPSPTADFSEPDHLVPASVMPRCSGIRDPLGRAGGWRRSCSARWST